MRGIDGTVSRLNDDVCDCKKSGYGFGESTLVEKAIDS